MDHKKQNYFIFVSFYFFKLNFIFDADIVLVGSIKFY